MGDQRGGDLVTGAVLATVNGPSGGGGGGGTGDPPDALSWSNAFGFTLASTQALTIAGVGSGTAPITATNSGGAALSHIQNGVSTLYTGAFQVADGDTLGWSLLNLTGGTEAGTVVVSSGAFTVATFTYTVRGNNNF
jgi:hypothetical protein